MGQGWSHRAVQQTLLSWATSTLILYDRQVTKLCEFCRAHGYVFPPSPHNTSVLAGFLCQVADSSEKPASQIKSTMAALTCLYKAMGLSNPWDQYELKQLTVGLVKSGTSAPSLRTKIMPVTPFTQLFRSWPDNNDICIKKLRLKAITLLALTAMTRPSDLAPKGVKYNAKDHSIEPLILSTDQVRFNSDGSLTLVFFGIKNDKDRKGFEVKIPSASDSKLDPVDCLKVYLRRTELVRPKPSSPLFIGLVSPFQALKSVSIANILDEAIRLAGLQGQGFTARSFRPTAASAAVQLACKPETAMQLGRWNTKEVFFNRYVYPLAPQAYTDNVLQFEGH